VLGACSDMVFIVNAFTTALASSPPMNGKVEAVS
jgi:hypothetical protein